MLVLKIRFFSQLEPCLSLIASWHRVAQWKNSFVHFSTFLQHWFEPFCLKIQAHLTEIFDFLCQATEASFHTVEQSLDTCIRKITWQKNISRLGYGPGRHHQLPPDCSTCGASGSNHGDIRCHFIQQGSFRAQVCLRTLRSLGNIPIDISSSNYNSNIIRRKTKTIESNLVYWILNFAGQFIYLGKKRKRKHWH